MPICTWREIAGKACVKCELPATHFVDEGPLCCQCHQKMGSHFLIPLFSAEDTKLAHEMVLKERREANKYDELDEGQELLEYIKNRTCLCEFCSGLKEEVMKKGLKAIKDYKGMICGGVEDMRIRLREIERKGN